MTHSIMFHHFHDDFHSPSQGSLSSSDFRDMLIWLNKKFNVLNADEYIQKFTSNTLEQSDVCLSFDDALLCQYDIAIPILEEFNLTAFFFVYSSVFSNDPDLLEIYRFFRSNKFENIDKFYNKFFDNLIQEDEEKYFENLKYFQSINYLGEFPFYTENDKWFRYLRDLYLGEKKYNDTMHKMMTKMNFNSDDIKSLLWMNEEQLLDIHRKGHIIGLHSYSHPTQISKLSKSNQSIEYEKNNKHLKKLLNVSQISTMAHPCGDYNKDTLDILKNMGIKIGFRSNMGIKEIKSSLEIPREDHANIYSEMQQCK